jgi:predicted transcriptional regulator
MSDRAVLMSIKPHYADMIFAGTKTVELRRVCPKINQGDLVLVYVSGPRMALVGGFVVGGIVAATPAELCRTQLAQSGLNQDAFLKYFEGTTQAYGIIIDRTWQFEEATELATLRRRKGGFQPPQSYRYVRHGEFKEMLD